MRVKLNSHAVYVPSEDIVAREIEGEIIIVPLVAGVGDAQDDLFSLNETGRAFWKLLDGKRSLSAIVAALKGKYNAPKGSIDKDVVGLAAELFKRRIICEKKRS